MLRYLSEDINHALEPFGIGMILAHINALGAKPWYIIDENNILKDLYNKDVPLIKLLEYTSPLSLILSDFSFATAFETPVLHISWQ